MKVDNTMLLAFQKCPLFFRERHELHWASRYASGALGHGGAVHEGLKAWYQNMKDGGGAVRGVELAVQAISDAWPENHPIDDFRTKERAQRLMLAYIQEYPSETFTILEVEVPFVFELGRSILWCKDCCFENSPLVASLPREYCAACNQLLEPIEYGGIFDTLTRYGPMTSQSVNYVLEHKTTSELGDHYFVQWEIHNQITGYCWGASQASGKLIGGANVNVLCLTKGGNMKFKRRMIGVNPSQIEEWKNDVAVECNNIARAQRLGHWQKRTDSCVSKFGTCLYHSVHLLSDPDERRRRLETDYVKEEWNFERRDDAAAAV